MSVAKLLFFEKRTENGVSEQSEISQFFSSFIPFGRCCVKCGEFVVLMCGPEKEPIVSATGVTGQEEGDHREEAAAATSCAQ